MSFTIQALNQVLQRLPRAGRYLVAFSGGVDSHVLLHALARMQKQHSLPPVVALHVHHGLHNDAEKWTRHCQQVCNELDIAISILRVNAAAAAGESPEEAARIARYRVLSNEMQAEDCLLTAHHQDDQAETLLLQLLRGSGPHGLAAMARVNTFGSGWHGRPMLGFTRAQIRHYAKEHGLHWIEDSSNADTSFDRNYLRQQVMPLLQQRWPAAAATISRSAGYCADAARLIDECAAEDLAALTGAETDQLPVEGLLQLGEMRRRHALRAWFDRLELPLPSTAHLEHLLHDVLLAQGDAAPRVCWPGAEVRRFQGQLYAMSPLTAHDAGQVLKWDTTRPLVLPGLGQRLVMQAADEGALDASLLERHDITVRFRKGGEHCRPLGRGYTKELKKLFQELQVPPWERDRIPLIYVGDTLAAIPGYLICEGFLSPSGQRGVLPVVESDTVV